MKTFRPYCIQCKISMVPVQGFRYPYWECTQCGRFRNSEVCTCILTTTSEWVLNTFDDKTVSLLKEDK